MECTPRFDLVVISDATDGVQAVRARGGVVIAQHPWNAAFSGMMSSAIRTGAVTHVVKLDEIVPLLHELVLGNGRDAPDAVPVAPEHG